MGQTYILTHIRAYTLFRHGENISYKIEIKKITDLHVCHVAARGGQLAIYLIAKLNKRSNGSDVRWNAIPQMCPTVAEKMFQKIFTGLEQSQFVFNIS